MRRFQVIVNGTNVTRTIDGISKNLGFVITRVVNSDTKRSAEISALEEVRELWTQDEPTQGCAKAAPTLNVLEVNEIGESDPHDYVSTGFVFYEQRKH